jgi:hypothetical protein
MLEVYWAYADFEQMATGRRNDLRIGRERHWFSDRAQGYEGKIKRTIDYPVLGNGLVTRI